MAVKEIFISQGIPATAGENSKDTFLKSPTPCTEVNGDLETEPAAALTPIVKYGSFVGTP